MKKKSDEVIPASSLGLLNTKAHELNPVKVLPLLPDNLPISLVSDYLRKAMQSNLHTLRTNQVVKNLGKMDVVNMRYKLSRETKKYIIVTKDRTCPVCHKRLGDKWFARFPNGVLCHFKCFSDPTVCPVTKQNFSWKPGSDID